MAPYGAAALAESMAVCERLKAAPGGARRLAGRVVRARQPLRAHCRRAPRHDGGELSAARRHVLLHRRALCPIPASRSVRSAARRSSASRPGLPAAIRNWSASKSHTKNGTTLPALFFQKQSEEKPRTVVVFDGMDNTARRMSVLFRGPGVRRVAAGTRWRSTARGRASRCGCAGCMARHDYEVPVARVRLCRGAAGSRSAHNGSAVKVGMAIQLRRYHAARIAAFEKRYAAGVAFSALHWDLAAFQRRREAQGRSSIPGPPPSRHSISAGSWAAWTMRCRASQDGESSPLPAWRSRSACRSSSCTAPMTRSYPGGRRTSCMQPSARGRKSTRKSSPPTRAAIAHMRSPTTAMIAHRLHRRLDRRGTCRAQQKGAPQRPF